MISDHKLIQGIALASCCFLLTGCGDDSGQVPVAGVNPVPFVRGLDISNAGNASDLEVTFFKPQGLTEISEFRILVVPTSESAEFGLDQANQVGSGAYQAVAPNGDNEQVVLSGTQTDVNSGSITEAEAYHIFVLSVAESGVAQQNALSEPSDPITLEQKSAIRNLTGYFNAGTGGMDVDQAGNVYMADFGESLNGGGTRVFRITPSGDISTFANGLNGASGNDFDSNGDLFQSNITGGFISRINPAGQANTFVTDGIVGPVGLAFDKVGNLYVANCSNNTIQKVTPEGESTLFSSGSAFNCPNGIDVDDSNNVFVANFGDGNVIKVEPDGSPSVLATIPGGNNGHLLLKDEQLYVIARGAHQIYLVDMEGNFELFAGAGQIGNDNGSLADATFAFPNDLAFSPDGTKMYVNDKAPDAASDDLSSSIIREIDIVD